MRCERLLPWVRCVVPPRSNDAQRKAKGRRAFAASRLSAGLGVLSETTVFPTLFAIKNGLLYTQRAKCWIWLAASTF